MPNNTLEQLARESIEAFNRADWDAIRAMSATGYVYEETGTGRRIEGVEAVIVVLQEWKAAFPDATGEITRSAISGDTAVLEIIWRGTQTGPLPTGAGVLPPSGRPIHTWATMWQRWDNGRLAEERHHLDVITMLAQLGALPAPAST